MKWRDINSIPKEIDDYINYRKRIKNTENLFIRNNYIFSREDFITNDYFLCEIILLLTALSKNSEIYMMKICDMNTDIQEFWSDAISKYIEMRSIREDESLRELTSMGMINLLSKDKMSKMSSNRLFEGSYSINKSNTNIDFDEHKNLVVNLKKINNQLEKEKNNGLIIINKYEKEIKEQKRIITNLNQINKDMIKTKDEKILQLEKKVKEYEEENKNLKIIIQDNESKLNKIKNYEEEIFTLKEKLIKSINENLVLKTYKEYKTKYETLILSQKNLGDQNQIQSPNIENITETKEKYLLALKNNINIQKENERLRKEIISLKEELKKEKKENSSLQSNNININENGKEINYKEEFDKINIKAERYKYLLDNKDKQIEQLTNELAKYKDGNTNENGGAIVNKNENNKKRNIILEEIDLDRNNGNIIHTANKNYVRKNNINHSNTSKKIVYKNLNLNNTDAKINSINKNLSTKNSNTYSNINQNIIKIEKSLRKKKDNSKSEKKKEGKEFNKKYIEPQNINNKSNNRHNVISSNLSYKDNLNINSNFSNNDLLKNPVLNLNSSVKIDNTKNFSNFIEHLKDNNINESYNKNNRIQKSTKKLNNSSSIKTKTLLDNIYTNIKKDKKSKNEFISFLKKINKELNLNISNQLHEITSNKNVINDDILIEQIKELKKELNQYKRKESDTKVKLTFLQSEKNKLEKEKLKLQDELKKISNNTPFKDTQKNTSIKKYYSSTKKVNELTNLNINFEIGKFNDIINDPSNKEKEEDMINSEKDKDKKYSFQKKKIGNKTPSIEAETALNLKKMFSGDKNTSSFYEEESNENNEKDINVDDNGNNVKNSEEINELKNKVNCLTNDKNSLEEKIKDLNTKLENTELKGNNLELINSNLIKENVELKQSLLLIKENYENEFTLVSSSLVKLTEKYQKLKQDLLNEKKEETK